MAKNIERLVTHEVCLLELLPAADVVHERQTMIYMKCWCFVTKERVKLCYRALLTEFGQQRRL